MKNIFTLFTVAFLFAVIFSSCKKTITNNYFIKDTTIVHITVSRDTTITRDTTIIHDSVYPDGIVGFWPGTFYTPGNYPVLQWSFFFKKDGTVRVYIQGSDADTANAPFIGDGIYRVIGLSVTTQLNIQGQLYSTLGTVDSSFIFYEGTIGQGLNTGGLYVNIAHKQ
jgi:hypothetical protein